MNATRTVVALTCCLATTACGDDQATPSTTIERAANATTSASVPATTQAAPAPDTTEPEIEIPIGVLVAVPTQNREDPAKEQFQIQLHNGTSQRYDFVALRIEWDGLSSRAEHPAVLVGGLVLDIPIPIPEVACQGDGTLATMPTLDAASVVLELVDGDDLRIPVVDKWHVARRIYLESCERQMIESLVTIEWADLHEEQFDGRPVTAGTLRISRRGGIGTFTIESVSNTVPYDFEPVDAIAGQPIATLSSDDTTVSVPVRFLESRCDPHALAEVKQPTKFVSQVRLPDGSLHPYIIYPDRAYWAQMRLTADEACLMLGEIEFVGD